MVAKPAFANRRQHAHGFNHFGVAQVVVGKCRRGHGGLVGVGQRLAGADFSQVGQAKQQDGANQHGQPEQRVEQEAHQQVNRRPRGVKEGKQAITGEELTHIGQVVDGLRRVAASALEIAFKRSGEHPLVQHHVQLVANADQHGGAHQLQQLHQAIQRQRHQRQHQQRGFIAAGQHPVVHLQHIDGWHQAQQVDDKAECAKLIKAFAKTVQGVAQFSTGDKMFFHSLTTRKKLDQSG